MSDDLDIRSGGVIAVDTESLRAAAVRYDRLGAELVEIERRVRSAILVLADIGPAADQVTADAEVLAGRVDAASAAAGASADRLRFAAAVYEIVELRAACELASESADPADSARLRAEIDARLRALEDEYPWAGPRARLMEAGRSLTWSSDLLAQGPGLLPLAAMMPGVVFGVSLGAVALAFGIPRIGAGTIPAQARLAPAATAGRVTAVAGPVAVSAPTTLAQAAERIPSGSGPARVRVETYTMRDGTRQFAVYVTGTRDAGAGGREAFDMASNVELYSGTRSASYDATLAALREAGARPGDVVHAFGHSQGAMVTAHVALEGGYDTRTLVSFGSPVEADVGDGTLSVSVRHTDDPVGALEGGGHLEGVGAPGSFVAERVADPGLGLYDLQLPAHGIDRYAETARMLDDSADPRMVPVRTLFDELGDAASVEVVEYSAERVSPSVVGAG
jgi:hypothetical protein